jgi:thiamine kinase-like enzyme
VDAVVNICKEMAQWKGEHMKGVDGQNIPEDYLTGNGDFGDLERTCRALGMGCTQFVFYHADLGPTNIIVEDQPSSGRVALIDFEIAGFFPTGWIRTKFRVSTLTKKTYKSILIGL